MSKFVKFLRCFFFMMTRELVHGFKQRSLKRLRLCAAKLYVRTVGEVRKFALVLMGVFVCLAVLGAGCALLPIGIAIFIFNRSNNLMLSGIFLMASGAIFLLVPLTFILLLTSERLWMRLFRVREMVELASDSRRIEP
jgi:hypothetical protein